MIYLVLAAQFESFRDPFIILIGLPASMFGALFFLFILGEVNGMMQNIRRSISAPARSTSIPRSAS